MLRKKYLNHLNDDNIQKKWVEYALKASLNNLNPPSDFNNDLVTEKILLLII